MSWFALVSISVSLTISSGCASLEPSSPSFAYGLELLQQSESYEQSSRDMLKLASQKRRELRKLHGKNVEGSSSPEKQGRPDNISSIKNSMIELRQEGAKKRITAKTKKAKAQKIFAKAMIERWPSWIKSSRPIMLDTTSPIEKRGHNTLIANIRRKPDSFHVSREKNQYRELLASIPDEQMAPNDLNLDAFQISRNRTMVGHIETENASGVPLNKIHSWRFVVSDVKGYPVQQSFEVLGHMPGHVHGLPTQPRITKKLDDGVYLIEGLKFQMRGWWVIELVSSEDRIRFNIVL